MCHKCLLGALHNVTPENQRLSENSLYHRQMEIILLLIKGEKGVFLKLFISKSALEGSFAHLGLPVCF